MKEDKHYKRYCTFCTIFSCIVFGLIGIEVVYYLVNLHYPSISDTIAVIIDSFNIFKGVDPSNATDFIN